jgi:bifunctional non-homologous end joining protein LigD
MLAVPSADLPVDDGLWAYEMKWDGMRALVGIEGDDVWLTSRAGNDATGRFPEIAPIADALGSVDALLDGELVALDERGVPSFERLQPRMQAHGRTAVEKGMATQPVVLMVFDVLWLAGHATCELPYTERRTLLERLELAGPSWQTPPATFGAGGTGTGAAVLETSRTLGLEGVVAKRVDSLYLPGRRADAWRKVKTTLGQELVVGGWLPGAGRLEGQLGSLLVGYHDDGDDDDALRFAGRVGSGIDASARERLERALAPLHRRDSPFVATPRLPSPQWVEPELVVEVAFHEWTTAGVLRAPRYRGLRDDKPAADVVRET